MSKSSKIFISYRRNDSQQVTRKIYDLLAKQFGHGMVFRDLDSIPAGETFKEYSQRELSQCQILISVIGPKWLEMADTDYRRRLDNPKDGVRLEIEWALKRKMSVIPLLINDTQMPQAEVLPRSLKTLTTLHAARLRHHFWLNRRDVARLVGDINQCLQKAPKTASPARFFYDVITVDERGNKRSRQQKTANYMRENLSHGVILDMVVIPGGEFLMGSVVGEGEENEHPQHPVTVNSFAMGKYPVTQAQWKAVAALPQVKRKLLLDPSKFKGGNHPVEKVSWYDAMEFCQRLSQKTGRTYRLPCEAEWEYACRAGASTPFHFGPTLAPHLANYTEKSIEDFGPKGQSREQTTPVGGFQAANGFGLYDMHGNVWEWCLDYWHENYLGAPLDGSAWVSNQDAAARVMRGGSWFNFPELCRSAYRSRELPDFRNVNFGLRVVSVSARPS